MQAERCLDAAAANAAAQHMQAPLRRRRRCSYHAGCRAARALRHALSAAGALCRGAARKCDCRLLRRALVLVGVEGLLVDLVLICVCEVGGGQGGRGEAGGGEEVPGAQRSGMRHSVWQECSVPGLRRPAEAGATGERDHLHRIEGWLAKGGLWTGHH